MSLFDLASIGSLVSGVAVLVSLVYLSVQVKKAERNQQASIRAARQDWLSRTIAARLSPREQDELAAAVSLLKRLVDD